MISINSFRVQNLRSICDSGDIKLKPITILVGRNSSGKSTLARIFPLLRQSAEASKRGPILWWGRLVDFGSFDEAINRDAENKEIGIDFKLEFEADDFTAPKRRGVGVISTLRFIQSGSIQISLKFKNDPSGTYTSSLNISAFDFNATLTFDPRGDVIEIKTATYTWKPTPQLICFIFQDRLIPVPAFAKLYKEDGSPRLENADPISLELEKLIKQLVHGNTSNEPIRRLASKIPLGSRSEVYSTLLDSEAIPSFHDHLHELGSGDSEIFKRLYDLAFLSQLDVLLDQVDVSMHSFLTRTIYLEPLRATAQRYYRQQSLAVEEIDSKGENIAVFLDSLPKDQQASFKEWTSQYFGIEVNSEKAGGHISLTVKQINGGVATNIADMGFGFSQMLPIAAQLWAAKNSRFIRYPRRQKILDSLVVIEQPELHLHPEYQAKIADIFLAAVKKDDVPGGQITGLKIIAETHSPALINQLGILISENKISKDDVQILLFEQNQSKSNSAIQTAEFDKDGILKNWPIGFFEPNSTN